MDSLPKLHLGNDIIQSGKSRFMPLKEIKGKKVIDSKLEIVGFGKIAGKA